MLADEPALLDRCRQGDLDAFNRLVEAYQRQVYNFCLRMLANREAAEDAAQNAFIAAFRSFASFRGGSPGRAGFRAWLFRIAANACYDELRRRPRAPLSLDAPIGTARTPPDLPHPSEPLDERAQRLELASLLQDALAALPPEQRLVVILRDVHGLAYDEIAGVARLSLGTVKSRISRARSQLRRLLVARGELLPARFRPTSEEDDALA